jgi:AhpD family alkylhydroperoxidase
MAPLPEDEWDEETRALLQTKWFSDRPTRTQDFFKTMVRHRELFRVWDEFGRAVFNGRLPDRDRELLILRTAWLTRCRFAWAHHQPLAERLGMTAQEIQRVVEGPDARGWSELDAALLRAVDELHAEAEIGDATWAVLRAHYDDVELIELPVVVGQYHLVAFFNNTMGVEVDPRLPNLPEPR